MSEWQEWTPADARSRIAVPDASSDKYSRGVLGVITGSDRYPGAAVLGVEAALRTGLGMVRYLGPEHATSLVLQRRPETVADDGRVQAWLIGSGTDHADRETDATARVETALAQSLPTVLDGGALEYVREATGPTIVTPHAGELARLMGVERAQITDEPAIWAARAADRLGATVLLKGHETHVCGAGAHLVTSSAPAWMATAGAGDALAGILGALVATHAEEIAERPRLLAELGATASLIHGLAGERASAGGPFTVLDLAAAVPATIAELLARLR